MITKKETKVNLSKIYREILYLYPAYNNTFVFLGSLEFRGGECVTHLDALGNILFEHIFKVPMNATGMLTDTELILLETRDKFKQNSQGVEQEKGFTCIKVLDLISHTFKRTKHEFLNQESDMSEIFAFAETKYLCIKEIGQGNDDRLKLSYYNYPLQQDSQPFNVLDAKDGEWNYDDKVKQANQHSMMAWCLKRHDQQWNFRTYDLRLNEQGKPKGYMKYKIKQEIGIPYGLKNLQCALMNIWETTKNCFMLVCITNKTEEHKNKQLGVIQNNYILNVKTEVIRQAKFSFGKYQEFTIYQCNLGPISMFRSFQLQEGEAYESPIFYVDNATETIIQKDYWNFSKIHKDQPTGVHNGMLIHNQYEDGDCEWFKCETIRYEIKPKEMALQFLLAIYKDFDQDLLQDVVEIIDYSE